MIRKKVFLLGIFVLVGALCLSQVAIASEGERGNIFHIGNLSGELMTWDSNIDVWHGSIVLNATVLIANTGNESIQIGWETTNTKDMFSVLGNWQGEVEFGIIYKLFKNDLKVSITMQSNNRHRKQG